MNNIIPNNEFVEVEGRYYVNPQVGLDESNAFIDNLRSTQQANNQKIQTDTYNLGTEISSNLGGLTSPVGEGGAGDAGLSYFTSRYQTPQTNAAVENLRAVAQAAALNDVLANEQAIWKNRYQKAYRNYQKNAYNRSTGASSGGGAQTAAGKGSTTTTSTSLQGRGKMSLDQSDLARGGYYVQDMGTNKYGGHDLIWVAPSGDNIRIPQLSDGSYANFNAQEFIQSHGGKNLPFVGGK